MTSINLTEALKKKEEEKKRQEGHLPKFLIVSQLEVLGYFSKEWLVWGRARGNKSKNPLT